LKIWKRKMRFQKSFERCILYRPGNLQAAISAGFLYNFRDVA
jgi:hypothetical protein